MVMVLEVKNLETVTDRLTDIQRHTQTAHTERHTGKQDSSMTT